MHTSDAYGVDVKVNQTINKTTSQTKYEGVTAQNPNVTFDGKTTITTGQKETDGWSWRSFGWGVVATLVTEATGLLVWVFCVR